jgi:hypothetical protein
LCAASRETDTDLEKSMTLSPGFVPSEAQVLLEMAQQAYSNAPSAPTCGVPSVRLGDRHFSDADDLHASG